MGFISLGFAFFFLSPAHTETRSSVPPAAQITGDFVRLRETPTREGKIVGVLFKYMTVTIVGQGSPPETIDGKTAPWYQVKGTGVSGWVFGGFLDFSLAHTRKNTFDGNSDLNWFFKKFGKSTNDYEKLKPQDFSLDQYRSLLSAAKIKPWSTCWPLAYTAYAEYKIDPNSPRMAYLRPKLFDPRFLKNVYGYLRGNGAAKEFLNDLLRAVPSPKWDDPAFVKELDLSFDQFSFVSDRLRDNESFMREPISRDLNCFSEASPRLRGDKKFILSLSSSSISQQPVSLLKNASADLQNDFDLALYLCALNARNLDGVSDVLINRPDFWEALLKSSTTLADYPVFHRYDNPRPENFYFDREVFDCGFVRNPLIIRMILKSTRISPDKFGIAENSISDKSYALDIVKSNGWAIKYVTESLRNDREIVYWAVKDKPESFQFARGSLKDDIKFVSNLMESHPAIFEYASERVRSDRTLALKAISAKPELLSSVAGSLVGDESLAVTAMKESNGKIFHMAPEWVRSNKKVAQAVLVGNPQGACALAGTLKDDKELALLALSNDPTGDVYRCFSKNLQGDRDVAFLAVRQNFNNLSPPRYSETRVPETLKNDRQFALMVVRERGWLLKYFPENIRADKEVALEAVGNKTKKSGPDASVDDFPPPLLDDSDFMLQAIRRNPWFILGISPRLKDNEQFIGAVLKNYPPDYPFNPEWVSYRLRPKVDQFKKTKKW